MYTDQNAAFPLHERTYFWAIMYYKGYMAYPPTLPDLWSIGKKTSNKKSLVIILYGNTLLAGKKVFFWKWFQISDCCQSKQMSYTDQNAVFFL